MSLSRRLKLTQVSSHYSEAEILIHFILKIKQVYCLLQFLLQVQELEFCDCNTTSVVQCPHRLEWILVQEKSSNYQHKKRIRT